MSFISKSQTKRKTLNRRERRKAPSYKVGPAPLPSLVQTVSPVSKVVYTKDPLILWAGEDHDNLFGMGALYGFNCQWFSGLDISSVRHAKGIVVSCAETLDKLSSFINFACDYGIPSIWLHKTLPPEVSYWSFDSHLHLSNSALFWRNLCHMVK